MTSDEYLQTQIVPMLQPDERVLHSAYMRRQPGLLMQIFFVGGLLLFLITKAYYVVLTSRRMILIRTKMSFWTGGPAQQNLGAEQWDARNLKGCTTSGFANNRSMTFTMHQGPSQTLRISPWGKKVQGTREFFEKVPQLINSGQLPQLAAGVQPLGMPGSPAQPPELPSGARVTVIAQDGNRYPGTIMHRQNDQYLCTMPNGQAYWFPAQSVSRA
ncbi:MAG TPA: hypothetical protein VFT22_23510 [Kofleriaceae bacterium]|nr:hypothetical protein [Kofleriaceae bacterium]